MADYNLPQRGLHLIRYYLPEYQALQDEFAEFQLQHRLGLQYHLCIAILLNICNSMTFGAKASLSHECETWYGMQLQCFRRLKNDTKALLNAIEEDLVTAYRHERKETGRDGYESTHGLRTFRNDVRDLLDRLKAARPDTGRQLYTHTSREQRSSPMRVSAHDSTASLSSLAYQLSHALPTALSYPPSPAQGHGIPSPPGRRSYDSDIDSDQLYESDSNSSASTLEESQSVWDRDSPEVPPEAPLPPSFEGSSWRSRWR